MLVITRGDHVLYRVGLETYDPQVAIHKAASQEFVGGGKLSAHYLTFHVEGEGLGQINLTCLRN